MSLLKKVGRWAGRRLAERSTYAGIATVIAGVVAPKIGLPVDQTAQVLTTVLGTVMISATTSAHPPLHEQ